LLPIEKNYKDHILETVKMNPKSISGIARDLRDKGFNMHRLLLTGYLQALRDLGYLKEREIPPAKVFQAAKPHKKDIYEMIGERASQLDLTKKQQAKVAIFVLQRLFNRPIFLMEVERCGLQEPVDIHSASSDERTEARNIMARASMPPPRNDPAYWVEEDYSNEYDSIMSSIFIDSFGIQKFMRGSTQVRLDI